jgi:ABC-type spermidine/putrescine transport system permease subunit II
VALVAFNAVIPLMTVVNYSVQETFGDNVFFWAGVMWFEQVLQSERFHDALAASWPSPSRSCSSRCRSASPLR